MRTPHGAGRSLSPLCGLMLLLAATRGNAENKTFEGVITASLSRAATETSRYVFTRKGNLLRIENTTDKLQPVNLVDFATNKLTIVYPHNTTFIHVDPTKKDAPKDATAGVPPMPQNAIGGPALPNSQMPPRAPGMPAADMPALPNPMMPPTMPPMPGMFGPAELKKTDKTKKIQGFDCTLYTASERGQNFEIWATGDSVLFPFRLVERDYLARRFGPQMLEEQWPELLRKKSLFPVEARLKMEPAGQERLTFTIDKIEKKKIGDDKLFQPPDKYLEIEAPGF